MLLFFLNTQSKIEFENEIIKISNKITYIHHPLYDNIQNIKKYLELKMQIRKKNKKKI